MTDTPAHGETAPVGPPGRSGKRLLRFLAITVLVVMGFILTAGLLAAMVAHFEVSQADLRRWQVVSGGIQRWGLLFQCLVLVAVGLWWRAIVAFGHRKGIVKTHEFDQVIGLRWTVLAFGIAYLVLVPIGPTTLWRFLMG